LLDHPRRALDMQQKPLNIGPALIFILLLSLAMWATVWGVVALFAWR
jgi:hypothetical protein